jgi:hypothetical protein
MGSCSSDCSFPGQFGNRFLIPIGNLVRPYPKTCLDITCHSDLEGISKVCESSGGLRLPGVRANVWRCGDNVFRDLKVPRPEHSPLVLNNIVEMVRERSDPWRGLL